MSKRDICNLCGREQFGPIFWSDELPTPDHPVCRRGQVVFSGDDLNGRYNCAGEKLPPLVSFRLSGDGRCADC